MFTNIAIIGSSGSIGSALIAQIHKRYPTACIHAFSRTPLTEDSENITHYRIDYNDERSIATSAEIASNKVLLDLILCTTGLLHDDQIQPEKSLKELSYDKFFKIFSVNTFLPALVAKHFLPVLRKDKKAVFAVLSARVGSISDNTLGGWYAYRASKTALNMIIKNAAIEIGRLHKQAILVALHPGTVESPLSSPYTTGTSHKIFTPTQAANHLLEVIEQLKSTDSGKIFAWDGEEILP